MPSNANSTHQHIEEGNRDPQYDQAFRNHVSRHGIRMPPVGKTRLVFESRRPRLVQECLAEALGTFFYV